MKRYYDKEMITKFGTDKLEKETEMWKNKIDEGNASASGLAMSYMDHRYFLCLVGGKMVVVDKALPERQLDITAASIYFQSAGYSEVIFDGLRTNKNGEIDIITHETPHGIFQSWIDVTQRYDGLINRPDLAPGHYKEGPFHYWNTWQGWAVEPKEDGSCEKFNDLILEQICNGKKDRYDYIMDYAAHMLQFPQERIPKIIAIRGEQGGYKGTFMDVLKHLMGDRYAVTISKDLLTSRFNSSMYGKFLVVADEAVWAGSRSEWGTLKAMTGNSKILIEPKGKDAFLADNYMRLMVTTNEDYAFPIEKGNRRVVIFTTSSENINNSKLYDSVIDELENGGYERLMFELMNRKITANFYGPAPIFDEEAFYCSRMESLSAENPVAKWVFDSIQNETRGEDNIFVLRGGKDVKSSDAYSIYCSWAKNSNEPKIVTAKFFGNKFKELFSSRHTADGTYYSINRNACFATLSKVIGITIKPNEEEQNVVQDSETD